MSDELFNGLRDNKITVHNSTSQNAYVLAVPNIAWAKVDLVYSALTLDLQLGMAQKAVVNLSSFFGWQKILTEIFTLSNFSGLVTGSYNLYGNSEEIRKQIESNAKIRTDLEKNIKKNGTLVKPGETKVVTEKAILGSILGIINFITGKHDDKLDSLSTWEKIKYIATVLSIGNPSDLLAVFKSVADVTLAVASEDVQKFSAFNSNSNSSWVVTDELIVRAKDGSTTEMDKGKGFHIHGRIRGSALSTAANDFLEPGDCLLGWNDTHYYRLMYHADGNLALYEDKGAQFSPPVPEQSWYSKALNAGASGLNTVFTVTTFLSSPGAGILKVLGDKTMEAGVDLAAGQYKALTYSPAELRWSTKTNGRPAYRVYAQTDGNVVVYEAPGKPAWALWPEPLRGHEDSFVSITKEGRVLLAGKREGTTRLDFAALYPS